MNRLEYVTPSQVAEMLGVSPGRVTQLADEPGFPKPFYESGEGRSRRRLWHKRTIEKWAAKNR
jgi:hypothetical protein